MCGLMHTGSYHHLSAAPAPEGPRQEHSPFPPRSLAGYFYPWLPFVTLLRYSRQTRRRRDSWQTRCALSAWESAWTGAAWGGGGPGSLAVNSSARPHTPAVLISSRTVPAAATVPDTAEQTVKQSPWTAPSHPFVDVLVTEESQRFGAGRRWRSPVQGPPL